MVLNRFDSTDLMAMVAIDYLVVKKAKRLE